MKKLLVIMALIVSLAGLGGGTALAAYNPLGNACNTNGNQSAGCNGGTADPITGPNGAIGKATRLLSAIAGVAAAIAIVVSGLYYVTSDGDPGKVKNAKSALIGAIIGIIIVAASQAILTLVIKKV